MLHNKIDTIISNGVATISGKVIFQKRLEQLAVPGMMMRVNCTQKY